MIKTFEQKKINTSGNIVYSVQEFYETIGVSETEKSYSASLTINNQSPAKVSVRISYDVAGLTTLVNAGGIVSTIDAGQTVTLANIAILPKNTTGLTVSLALVANGNVFVTLSLNDVVQSSQSAMSVNASVDNSNLKRIDGHQFVSVINPNTSGFTGVVLYNRDTTCIETIKSVSVSISEIVGYRTTTASGAGLAVCLGDANDVGNFTILAYLSATEEPQNMTVAFDVPLINYDNMATLQQTTLHLRGFNTTPYTIYYRVAFVIEKQKLQ